MGTAAPTNLERGRIGFATLLAVDILFRCALVFFNNRSGQRELLLADNPDFGPNCGSREFTKTARRMLIKGMAMNAGCLKHLLHQSSLTQRGCGINLLQDNSALGRELRIQVCSRRRQGVIALAREYNLKELKRARKKGRLRARQIKTPRASEVFIKLLGHLVL